MQICSLSITKLNSFYIANHNLVLRQLIARDKEALNMKKNYSHIVHKHQQLRKDYQKLIGKHVIQITKSKTIHKLNFKTDNI